MSLVVECELTCDSCGLKSIGSYKYMPLIGFETGDNWVTHKWSDFVQCRRCFEEADKKYKENKAKTSLIKRAFGIEKWWYQFAKGHSDYKDEK